MTESNEYILRGQRVPPMTPRQIELKAQSAMTVLKIDHSAIGRMDEFIEDLWDKFGINVEVLSDDTWLGFAEALCDPSRFTIAMPDNLYSKITRLNDPKAIFIFFHELGHLILGHKPALHYSETSPTECEDAEWQADYFAEVILSNLENRGVGQLNLEFK